MGSKTILRWLITGDCFLYLSYEFISWFLFEFGALFLPLNWIWPVGCKTTQRMLATSSAWAN